MNVKFAFFLLFIGASSASFMSNVNNNVAAKKKFETFSSPIFKAVQKKIAEKDIVDDLLAVLAQIIAEFELLGEIVSETLIEDLQNLLADLAVIGDDVLAQVVEILGAYVDQLPQVIVDILNDLGLLPPPAKAVLTKAQKGVITELLDLLLNVAQEVITTGAVSDASLQAIVDLLGQVEGLDQLLQFLEPLLVFLPQELIDVLIDLGVLPAGTTAVANKQDDITAAIIDLILQMALEIALTGVISDASLTQLLELLTQVDILGELLALLEPLLSLLPQELIDLLVDLGILPPAKALTKAQKGVITELLDLILNVAQEVITTGAISDASLQAIVDLLGQVEGLDQLLQFLEPLLVFLPQELIDVLIDLGVLPTGTTAVANKQDDITAAIIDLILQMALEIALTGVISDASLTQLLELLTQVDILGELLALLEPLLSLLPQELIDLLVDLGIIPGTKVAVKQDVESQIIELILQIALEVALTGGISQESIQGLVDLLTQLDVLGDLLALIEPLLDWLPQELIDLLVELGIITPGSPAALTKAQKNVITELLDLLLTVAQEVIATGAISDASLQAIVDLLGQVEGLDQLLQFLEPLLVFLPQELIDVLIDLGVLPAGTTAVAIKQDDITAAIIDLILQMALEIALTGVISDASLTQLLELLTQVDILGELLALLEPLLSLLPQELIDLLVDLGILPPAKVAIKQDIESQIIELILQIALEVALTGVISEDSIQGLLDLLTQLDVLGDLIALIEPLLDLLPQELIDLLVELGIIPAGTKVQHKDVIDDLLAVLAQIIAEFELLGELVSETLLEDLQNLLADLQVIEEDVVAQIIEILGAYVDMLPQVVIDILNDLGLLPPSPTQAVAKKVRQDIIGELLALIFQLVDDLAATGTVSDETLQAIGDLLSQLEILGGLDQLLELLEPLLVFLPQELIDILIEIGILPPATTAVANRQDDIVGAIIDLLLQIALEVTFTGTISQESIDALLGLLAQTEVIADLIEFIQPLLDFFPPELIDLLIQLGLLPGSKVDRVLAALERTLSAKDIWTDLVDALMLQLVQIIADLESWGVELSDEALAQIENFILAVMAEGGQAWETLQAFLEQYAVELSEILGELLAEIGIPKTSAAISQIKATKDIFDDIFNALMEIIAQIESFGEIISEDLIQTFTDLLLQLEGVSEEAFQLVVALLEQYAEILYEQFGDLLAQLGITVPDLVTPASTRVTKDIIDDFLNILAQILAEIEAAGAIISEDLIAAFGDLVLQLEEVGGLAFEMVLALLTQYAELLVEQFGDLLEQLGITVAPVDPTEAPAF